MDLVSRSRLYEELKRADRRSMFRAAASEIAHELLTPLNVVQARAQLLSLRESDDEIDTNIQVILDQVQRVATCLRQMVDAASGEGPHADQTSIPEICDQACNLVRPLAEVRKVALEVRPTDVTTTRLDRLKTLQVLTNTLTNSLDAMPDGGTIEIAVDKLHVDKTGDIGHAAPGPYIRFTVRDRGRGFDVAALGARLSSTPFGTAPKLGFVVCRNVLKELRGWMAVESEPGSGATILIYVPDGDHA